MLNFLKIKSLGARIIAINLIGLIFLGTGFLFVDKSQNNLIEARKEALILQANLIAFSFTLNAQSINQELNNVDNLFLTQNWTSTKIARTQIFNENLQEIFDSRDFEKETIEQNIEEEVSSAEKPQQSFIFENQEKEVKLTAQTKIKYKLPSIEFLEKSSSKPSLLDVNKNRPNAEFMEKILLDFGIDGKIKTINNGPVVSLYEFEPARGVKVSKIIILSEVLARNTISTSA